MSDILVQKYQHYFNESVKLQETVNEQLAYIAELEDAIIALDEVYRMTPERDAILKREKKKALLTIDDSLERSYELRGEEEMPEDEQAAADAAYARKGRINLINMKTKPMKEREFGNHPDLLTKYFPDELPDRNKELSDKALNRDLKKARKVEKKNTVKEEVLELDETSRELKLSYLTKATGADPNKPSQTRSGMGNSIVSAIRGLEDAAQSRDEDDRKHFQAMYDKRRAGIRGAIRSLGKKDTAQNEDKKQ